MKLELTPSKISGSVVIPPSKSLAHRGIIAASLAQGRSVVSNLSYSDDIIRTIEAMKTLGVSITSLDGEAHIDGVKELTRVNRTINCGESGSTVRFLIPIALLAKKEVEFIGEGRLAKRPLTPFYSIFNEQGIKFSHGEDDLPLTIDGSLKPGVFNIRGDISSQFITGLLFTLPLLSEESTINITTDLESKGYLDLTLDTLDKFGITVINNNYKSFVIPGNQTYTSKDYRVEGDFSQVAFWLVSGLINEKISCKGMNLNSLQGDKAILDIINDFKGRLEAKDEDITTLPSETKGSVIDLSQCPDLGPIVTVLAALSKGTTKIINAGRLRIKESDRITAMRTELNKIGAKIAEEENGMIIEGVEEFTGGVTLSAWNDHRIAMALAIASGRCKKPIIIDGCESVNKSYPHFWEDFKTLGGNFKKIED